MHKIVLASGSATRVKLFESLGIPFVVEKSDYDESKEEKIALEKTAEILSFNKALTVAKKHQGEETLIIGADTIILLQGESLVKPLDDKDAKAILTKLGGTVHEVITGLTIVDAQTLKYKTQSVKTKVYFKNLTEQEIEWYVNTKEPFGKAGAYAMQGLGARFVEKIEGDPTNVMGLPMKTLVTMLESFKIKLYE